MANVSKSKAEIATIDCSLVTIEVEGKEFGFDTSNQISVEPSLETTEAIKLIVKGILRAQKPKSVTITGTTITLSDNVFNPELVQILQGGTIVWDETDASKIISYTPPVTGSKEKGAVFTLNAYSAIYDSSGIIQGYEKISYPNCQGQPIALSSQDDTFRAPSYTIESYPAQGEAAYTLTYVDALPELA